MDDFARRHGADRTRARPRHKGLAARPDRIALWAVVMAVVAMLAAATTSAEASSGGLAVEDGQPARSDADPRAARCISDVRFGQRNLRRPHCGADVRTLNWILKSLPFERNVRLAARFDNSTERTVRTLQRRARMNVSGVVNQRTRRTLLRALPAQRATWYGPGFWGNRTACGQRLRHRTVGVAHRTLPCGTRVTVGYRGRFVNTRVIDRGPYAHGARWDLTQRLARHVGLTRVGVDDIRVAVVR